MSTDALDRYVDEYEHKSDRPQLRSVISRGSKVVTESRYNDATGEWRQIVRMSRDKFDDRSKDIFLEEFAKWGSMGEAAAAAGVTTGTVRRHIDEDEDFAEAMLLQEGEYRDKLISHHQNLLFNGTIKESFDRNGQLVSRETIYPIRLIELELKKHDKGYRDKQELSVNHSGGVVIAPATMESVDDWETRFGKMKDITPPTPQITKEEEEEESPTE